MSSGEAVVQGWIRALRRLPAGSDLASELAPVVDAQIQASARAGTTPEGAAWKPRVDGARALKDAASATRTTAVGRSIVITVSGPAAIHNYGTKKDPQRRILPTLLPSSWAGKLAARVFKVFRARLFGGRA